MVGLTDLGEAAWEVEQVMNLWLEQKRAATPALFDCSPPRPRPSSNGSPRCAEPAVNGVDDSKIVELAKRAKGQQPKRQLRR